MGVNKRKVLKGISGKNIPELIGEKAAMIIFPLSYKESLDDDDIHSWYLMKAQEQNGYMRLLNEQEEDAWDNV